MTPTISRHACKPAAFKIVAPTPTKIFVRPSHAIAMNDGSITLRHGHPECRGVKVTLDSQLP